MGSLTRIIRVIESIAMSDEARNHDGSVELGPIATRVIYEDDRMRTWDQANSE